MRKTIALVLAMLLVLSSLTLVSADEEKVLNLFTWAT